MRQFCQRVCLIHKLRQRRRSEELLDCCGDRADIDQALRSDDIQILQSHALADHTLHTAETDTELVLKQFADTADTTVTQVVDIISITNTVCQTVQIIDRCIDVIQHDMFRNQDIDIFTDRFLQFLSLVLIHQVFQHEIANALIDIAFCRIEIHEMSHVNHSVGKHLYDLLFIGKSSFNFYVDAEDTAFVHFSGLFTGDHFPCLGDHFAGGGIGYGIYDLVAHNTGIQSKLFIEFIAAHSEDVIAMTIIEQAVEHGLGAFHRGRIARAKLAIDLNQAFIPVFAGILFQSGNDSAVLTEDLKETFIGDASHRSIRNAGQPGSRLLGIVRTHSL